MFCTSCGNKIPDGSAFCTNCGKPVISLDKTEILDTSDKTEIVNEPLKAPENPIINPITNPVTNTNTGNSLHTGPITMDNVAPAVMDAKTKGGNGLKIAGIVALIVAVVALLGTVGFLFGPEIVNKVSATSFSGNYEKAESALEDGDYELAIGYFTKALDEDADNEDAYIGLATAYLKTDDVDKAVDTLVDGYEKTESEDILSSLSDCLAKDGRTLADVGIKTESDESSNSDGSGDANNEESVVAATPEPVAEYSGPRTDIDINVRQVDASNFPEVVLYASITDKNGNTVDNMTASDFGVTEIDKNGNVIDARMNEVYRVLNNDDKINVNLVLDASGSMDGSKMTQAKNAANSLLDYMSLNTGDRVEVISFDDYVYLEQDFTSQQNTLVTAINGISGGGMTALYDALYAGIYQTYFETGAKCVIAFTDGAENASSYSFNDVVDLAQNTGIPVFIIGIQDYDYDHAVLQDLASQCSGNYYSANDSDLQSILEDIYIGIYREQQDYYVVKYTSQNEDNLTDFRDVKLETSKSSAYTGAFVKSYAPQADVTGAFSSEYMNRDYIFDFSSSREVTFSDLQGMSLAELRIARNEIFARHGRQFKDPMLNQWFYSKTWYLNIPNKYAPDFYDANRPDPLSKLESQNVTFIKEYEDSIIASQDIYPNARTTLLTEYDLALSDEVLIQALNQMRTYSVTDTLKENIRLVEEAIAKGDIQY